MTFVEQRWLIAYLVSKNAIFDSTIFFFCFLRLTVKLSLLHKIYGKWHVLHDVTELNGVRLQPVPK